MPATLPLLHVAEGAASTASLFSIWLLFFGLALAAGAFAGWCSSRLLRGRTRQRIAIFAAGMLTALALVPSAIPYDHLLPGEGPVEQTAVHAAHCHESAAGCADAPITSGPGQMIDAAPLLAEPAMLSVLLLTAASILIGVNRRPVLRPPMRAVAASI
jgi:predicted permease